jgi:hypothetical protein
MEREQRGRGSLSVNSPRYAPANPLTLPGGRHDLIIPIQGPAYIHLVDAEKTNGDTIRAKVIAFYTVRDGKIVHVDELTHLLHGADEDRDMGSRTSR